jgi:hypothetical protein
MFIQGPVGLPCRESQGRVTAITWRVRLGGGWHLIEAK